MDNFNISLNILNYFSLFIACFGFYHWKWLAIHFRIYVLLRLTTFAFNLINELLIANAANPNHVSLFSSMTELILTFLIFYLVLKDGLMKQSVMVVLASIILFDISFWIYDGGQSKSIFIIAVNASFLLVLCLYYLYQLLVIDNLQVRTLPMFWVTSGLLIKISGALILYITNDYLYAILKEDLINMWTFRNILAIAAFGFTLFGVWLEAKQGRLKAFDS